MAKNTNLNLTIKINGKEVKNTLGSVQKEMYKLKREVSKTTRGTEEYVNKSKDLKKVTKIWKNMKQEISGVPTLLDKIKDQFGAVGTIAGGIFAVDKVMDYAKAIIANVNEMRKLKNTIKQITNLNGEALDQATAKTKALATSFEADHKKMTESANNLSKNMKIDYSEALDLIEQGFLDGADSNGEFLDKVREYPVLLKEAGLSAEQSIALMTQEVKQGIYSDKGVDAIKEANIRLREMPKTTAEALDSIGVSSKTLQKELSEGSITTFEAIQKVSKRLATLPPQSKLVGQAIADIFAGAGEDAGYRYLSNLHNIDLTLNTITKKTDKYTEAKKLEVEANEALNSVWLKLTGTGSSISLLYSSLKLGLADLLTTLAGVKDRALEAKNAFNDQANEVINLQKNLEPLLDEYDNLKEKGDLTVTEQERLNVIIKKVSETVPSAITAFDEYGKAMDISTGKARDFVGTQKALLSFRNKEAIEEQKKELEDFTDEITRLQKKLEGHLKGLQTGATKNSLKLQREGMQILTDDQINETQYRLDELQNLEKGAKESIDQLTGDYLQKLIDKEKEQTKKTAVEIEARKSLEKTALELRIKNFSKMTDAQLKVEIEKRIERNKKLSDLRKKQADKEKKENEKRLEKEQAYREKVLFSDKDLIEQERTNFAERKELAGIFETNKTALTEQQKEVLEILEKQHQANLAKIELDATNKHLAQKKATYDSEKRQRQIANNNQLAGITSLSQAKKILEQSLSDSELSKINSLEEAKAALKRQYEAEELQKQAEFLTSLVELYTVALNTGEIEGVNFADKILTEEQKEALNKQLEEIRLKLSEVNAEKNGSTESPDLGVSDTSSLDIFGMTPEQWEKSFSDLDTAKGKVTAVAAAVQGLANAYSMYSEFVSNAEQRELQKFEKTQNKRKEVLLNQLDNGLINQDKYNTEVEKLDNELAKKRADIEYKQAKRSKAIALMEAITGTAAGIAKALPKIPLAIAAGAMGALQIGLIASTPLPEKGYKDGGFTKSLGYKDHTGEDVAGVVHADEYVIPKYVMNSTDPYVPKVIQYLEHKRKEKLGYFNTGGHTSTPAPEFTENATTTESNQNSFNNYNNTVLNRLANVLEIIEANGIEAFIGETAKNGKRLEKTIKKYTNLKNKRA